ncbi:MAG: Dabb family protein [Clostridia bacterium]
MVKHVVLFQIKPEFKPEIPQLVENFLAMRGKIEGLVDLQSGADFLASARSYDMALICTFTSRAALEAYQDHPVHVAVKARIHAVRSGSVACDFEF